MAAVVGATATPVVGRPLRPHVRPTEPPSVLTALMLAFLLAGIATLVLAVQADRPAPAPADRPVEGWVGESPGTEAMVAELPAPPEAVAPDLGAVAGTSESESEPRLAVGGWARVVNTAGRGVVLHTEPRKGARMPTGLLEGAQVTLVELAGDEWARVRPAQGQLGWVPTEYLAPVD
jgi:hypothetical protein